jgi:hypothetical protein
VYTFSFPITFYGIYFFFENVYVLRAILADELDKKADETEERTLKLKREQEIVQANLEAQREQHEKEEEELISIK